MLGPYDFVNILEAPDNQVIARVASSLGSRGTLQPVTYAALTVEEMIKGLEIAKSIK